VTKFHPSHSNIECFEKYATDSFIVLTNDSPAGTARILPTRAENGLLRTGRLSGHSHRDGVLALHDIPDLKKTGSPCKGVAQDGRRPAFRKHFMLTTALAVPCFFGYGTRQSQAACVNTGGSTYLCSGAETTTQTITSNNAGVSMDTGAAVDTSAGTGNAITVTGDGALSFTNTAGGAIAGADMGLSVISTGDAGATSGAVTVTTTETVSATSSFGILASNNGTSTGATAVSAADVTSANHDAIFARNTNTGTDLSVTSTGTVSGRRMGIDGRNDGSGTLNIHATDVTGTTEYGINAWNEGTTLTIATTGTVTGGQGGIQARNYGTDLNITSTGTVSGGDTGIFGHNAGSGILNIHAMDATGTGSYGINAWNQGTNLAITSTGTVSGESRGIRARNTGTGTLTVNAATVTGTNIDGISAWNDGTDLSITSTGTVIGGQKGIYGRTDGAGALTITAAGVTGGSNDGIHARNQAAGTDITITTTGPVSGADNGVRGHNYGTGGLAVTAAQATGTGGSGIHARNSSNGTDLTVTGTGTVSGGKEGIYARNDGTGDLTVTSRDATGTGSSGIDARNFNAGKNVIITSTGTATGLLSGIYSRNFGTQAHTINAANATGNTDYGIDARNNGTDLSITATGNIQGAKHGLRARNFGSGALTIHAFNVSGDGNDGIYAANFAGTDLSITSTWAVTGKEIGVFANNDGSGALSITVNNVVATGSAGIYGRGGAGGASITVNGAISGARDGIALNVTGASTLTIAANSSLTGSDNAINTTIGASNGDENVFNNGTVTGNVLLGGGANAFTNSAGGIFNALDTVNLGAGNSLTNSGTLSPGGMGTVQTTALTGDLVQTGNGRISVDVDPDTPASDRINVTGTASLAGGIEVNMLGTPAAAGTVTILSAAGGVTDIGLSAIDTAAVDYTLSYPTANDVTLGYSVDFTPGGASLTANQAAIGAHLDAILAAGTGGMDALHVELMKIESLQAYLVALDQLQGEHFLVQAGTAVRSLHGFRENLLSCPSLLDGVALTARDDHCLWGRFNGGTVDIGRSGGGTGGDETSFGFSGGYELPIGENMRAGLAVTIESSDLTSGNSSSSDGMRYTIGAKFEKTWGALEAALGAYGGIATYDTARQVGLGFGTATSDQDIVYGGFATRLSHTYDVGGFRVVPMLDLAATHVRYGGITETGAGAANLTVSGDEQWVLSATPAIGAMGTLLETPDYRLNASVKAGASFYAGNDYSASSAFSGAAPGVPGFVTSTGFDDVLGHVTAALELQTAGGLSLKLGYNGGFGNVTQSHGGHLRAILPF
jgi:hypothetical protein